MGQRLGIAVALLGDPQTLILDEPVNGLDPEGVLWVRDLLKDLAAEGRTVFVSSHLMSEMALTADHADRHRPRPADRRHHGRGVHRPRRRQTRHGPHAGGRALRDAAGRPGRHRHQRPRPACCTSQGLTAEQIGTRRLAAHLPVSS